ncbi:MAG: T9SS type A sorting domain-containing protein [Ignavibacteriaceae bacterium]|nr:T9SS type A sorting domain-containing protein [Ignavibacteriaceae bacterium]
MKENKMFIVICLLLSGLTSAQVVWESVGTMPNPVAAGQAFTYNERIYVVGGYSSILQSYSPDIQVYDPQTRNWTVAGFLRTPRAYFSLAVYNDSLYVWGGVSNDTGLVTTLESWGFENGTFTSVVYKDTTFYRNRGLGFINKGQLIMIGGSRTGLPQGYKFKYLSIFDLNERVFIQGIDTVLWSISGLTGQLGTFVKDKFYMFGGEFIGIGQQVLEYIPGSQMITSLNVNTIRPRAGGRAVTLKNDNMALLIGGYRESISDISDVELFDFRSSNPKVYNYGNLIIGRNEPLVALVGDEVYVFGGFDRGGRVISLIEKNKFTITGINENNTIPNDFDVSQNYPNPFYSETSIEYSLPQESPVLITVYDLLGNQIFKRNYENLRGENKFTIDFNDINNGELAQGIYFIKLTSNTGSKTRKVMYIK